MQHSVEFGGLGPGFTDPFYTQSFLRMNQEFDGTRRIAMVEEYFDHVHEEMLHPCVVEEPYHPVFDPQAVTQRSSCHSINTNPSGMNSFGTPVLAR